MVTGFEDTAAAGVFHISFMNLTDKQVHNLTRRRLPPWWVILDNGSTTHIICTADLVQNIRLASEPINIHSSGGVRRTDKEASMGDVGTVYYDESGIANILSFAKLREEHEITYDCKNDVFTVHLPTRQVQFRRSKRGVYYFDCRVARGDIELLNTV